MIGTVKCILPYTNGAATATVEVELSADERAMRLLKVDDEVSVYSAASDPVAEYLRELAEAWDACQDAQSLGTYLIIRRPRTGGPRRFVIETMPANQGEQRLGGAGNEPLKPLRALRASLEPALKPTETAGQFDAVLVAHARDIADALIRAAQQGDPAALRVVNDASGVLRALREEASSDG